MADPLTQIVALLRPSAGISKLVVAGGPWEVRRSDAGLPFYGAVLEGSCLLSVAGQKPVILDPGDFILVPAAHEFATSSLTPPAAGAARSPVETSPGVFRLGDPDRDPDVRMLVGHCSFGSGDASLLVPLLPRLVHVRGQGRLVILVELLDAEVRGDRPGRDVVLAHLIELLLIEALRWTADPAAAPGLLRGLADPRLAIALRDMHEAPTRAWTVTALASRAALSRSVFFERFRREVGVTPMDYLLGWRMALAKDLLRGPGTSLADVAEQVGYGSASTFSVAFARHVGTSPNLYARRQRLA